MVIHQSMKSEVKWNVERHIQTNKNVLKKIEEARTDQHLTLLSLRNTPISEINVSTAQLLFSRRLRDTLPVLSNKLLPMWLRTQRSN